MSCFLGFFCFFFSRLFFQYTFHKKRENLIESRKKNEGTPISGYFQRVLRFSSWTKQHYFWPFRLTIHSASFITNCLIIKSITVRSVATATKENLMAPLYLHIKSFTLSQMNGIFSRVKTERYNYFSPLWFLTRKVESLWNSRLCFIQTHN